MQESASAQPANKRFTVFYGWDWAYAESLDDLTRDQGRDFRDRYGNSIGDSGSMDCCWNETLGAEYLINPEWAIGIRMMGGSSYREIRVNNADFGEGPISDGIDYREEIRIVTQQLYGAWTFAQHRFFNSRWAATGAVGTSKFIYTQYVSSGLRGARTCYFVIICSGPDTKEQGNFSLPFDYKENHVTGTSLQAGVYWDMGSANQGFRIGAEYAHQEWPTLRAKTVVLNEGTKSYDLERNYRHVYAMIRWSFFDTQ